MEYSWYGQEVLVQEVQVLRESVGDQAGVLDPAVASLTADEYLHGPTPS